MNRLEWWTAWRHLQARRSPTWLRAVTLAALYLALIGGGFLLSSALTPRPGLFSPMVLRAAPVDYAGGVGVVSLGLAAIVLAFCGLARLFNLLATIITFSVAQGCMALVLVLGLMSGLELDLRGRLLDHKAHLRIARADGAGFVADDALLTGLLAAPEVAGASPILEGEVLLRTAYAREGATLLGIDPARHRGVTALATEVEQGSYAFLGAPERIPRFAAPPPPEPGPELPTPPSPVPSDTSPAAEAPLPADTAAAPVPSAMPAAVPDDEDAADDGGWEDPAVEIPRLRAEGQLPAALPPAQPAISDDPDETNAPEEPEDSAEPVLPPSCSAGSSPASSASASAIRCRSSPRSAASPPRASCPACWSCASPACSSPASSTSTASTSTSRSRRPRRFSGPARRSPRSRWRCVTSPRSTAARRPCSPRSLAASSWSSTGANRTATCSPPCSSRRSPCRSPSSS
ncbi:MAG: hypothetical protein IPO88_16090 [Nannocystis sp.]|nr:hypothetical protein [Nannocystis sp.]MBK9754988.1 hypothetical protein [Nannocystis sp.]